MTFIFCVAAGGEERNRGMAERARAPCGTRDGARETDGGERRARACGQGIIMIIISCVSPELKKRAKTKKTRETEETATHTISTELKDG